MSRRQKIGSSSVKLDASSKSSTMGRTGTLASAFRVSRADARRATAQISSTETYPLSWRTNSRPMPELAPVTMAMFI